MQFCEYFIENTFPPHHTYYDITMAELLSMVSRFNMLAKYVPKHKDKAQTNHNPKDNGVPPLSKVDLVHQVVDHREFVCQIIQLGLDSLKEAGHM